jgi:hypothetical protein
MVVVLVVVVVVVVAAAAAAVVVVVVVMITPASALCIVSTSSPATAACSLLRNVTLARKPLPGYTVTTLPMSSPRPSSKVMCPFGGSSSSEEP